MKHTNTPTLRFGEFDGEWSEKRYGDIYSFYTTNSYSRDNLNYEIGTVRNIHYGDIHTKFSTMFYLEKEKVPFINEDIELNKIKDESYCQVGDLVIADASEDYADIGKTMEIMSLNNEKTLAGLHTFLARPNKYDMALGYAGYLLQSYKIRKQIMRIAQGTKVLSLSTKRLADVALEIPTKPEQQKIATFLSAVDSSIEQLSQKEQLLRDYKKGVMQKIFARQIRFKRDDGGEFEDWVEKRLGDVAECLDNLRKPLNGQERQKIQGDIPYWGANNIMDYINDYIFDETLILLAEDGGNFNDFSTRPIANLSYGKCWVNNHTHILREIVNVSINEFLFYSLVHKNITGYISGGTRAKLIKSEMLKIKINLPSLPEQTKIANFLSSLDKQIEQVQSQLDLIKKFKKSLLQQMFI